MLYRFAEFELCRERYELRRGGRTIPAEPRVLEVLAYLIEHRDRVVPKQELLDALWQQEFVTEAALTRAVREVRRALGDTGAESRWIKTVYGRGFRWNAGVEEVPADAPRPAPAAEPVAAAAPAASPPAAAPAAVPARPAPLPLLPPPLPLPPRPPGAAAPSRRISSLAVLPLENLSGDPAQEYFADGITDALINEFARIGALKVISRTSAMQYKRARKPLPEIGRELGVEAVVDGSVLLSGDRVRVHAQLLLAASDEHLWAGRYDRRLEDVLELHSELAHAIVEEVNVKLTPQERARFVEPRPQVDPEVYLLDLEGRHVWQRRTEAAFREALGKYEQAIARDPGYAPAWVGVADCHNMLGNYGILPPSEVHGPARAAALRALELDPGSAEAHRALALMHWNFEFAWPEAEAEYRRAAELDPNSSLVHYWHGVCLGIQGRFAESFLALALARELDPLALHVTSVIGWMHYHSRRYAESLPYYQQVLAADGQYLMGHWLLGEAYVELGEPELGAAALERALALSGRAARFLGYLGYAYARAGRRDDARRMLDELAARRAERYVPLYFPALVHAGLGETEAALDTLERAWEERDTMLRDLKVDPPWERLHGEPRYEALLARLGLAR